MNSSSSIIAGPPLHDGGAAAAETSKPISTTRARLVVPDDMFAVPVISSVSVTNGSGIILVSALVKLPRKKTNTK